MSNFKLSVVEGEESEVSTKPHLNETTSVPSPEELSHIGNEEEIVEGIEEGVLSEADYEMAVMKTVEAMQQIVRSDNALVALLIHPSIKDGFERVWKALPEEVVPQSWKDHLQIIEDTRVTGVQILTQRDIERQFLLRHYGPRESGGNGLIPCLQEWCERNRCPVFVTDVNFLRTRFLNELADRIYKQIHVPMGSQLIR